MKFDRVEFERKALLAEDACRKGYVFYSEENRVDDFDRGCRHTVQLLNDSYLLYRNCSYATSAFLAICAIEEIAKVEVAMFRKVPRSEMSRNRKNDPLFSHRKKHSIAIQEVIVIGKRLVDAIGENRLRDLMNLEKNGKLVELRESALYADNVEDAFVCPSERIDKALSRELLLLAIEVWDDRLIGWTNHTYELEKQVSRMFEDVANSDNQQP